MCDICVMNTVKAKMLSRRKFLKGVAASSVTAAAGTAAIAPSALAQGVQSIEDLTHTLSADFPTYFGKPGVRSLHRYNFESHGFNLFQHTINEHTGTHVDAPLHYSADGASIDEIAVSNLVAPLCIIDIRQKASEDADAQLTPDDIKAWISANGDIPENACVAMHSGWTSKLGSDDYRGYDGDRQHYPGFHVESAKMLMEEASVSSIAVDTLSLDHGMSRDFATHHAWLPSGRFGIENIANLDKLPASGATIVVGATKMEGGSGGPARIFAMV